MPDATFDASAWEPAKQEYGLLHLLIARSAILEELASIAPARNRLKALDIRLCSPALGPSRPPPRAPLTPSSLATLEEDDDSDCSYISEGEPQEPTQVVSWGKGQRGAWWRVRTSLREDLVVRSGLSLASAELRRLTPGELLQQKGCPRVLSGTRSHGCIRMPIQPFGWVTADASRCGGSQYLVRAHTPRWKAVYKSPASGGDVIVRSSIELESDAVLSLFCGDIVEQAGPQEPYRGIMRMPVVVPRRGITAEGEELGRDDFGVVPKVSGWVTVDATAAGGPVFFKFIADNDPGMMGKARRGRAQQAAG